MTFEEWYLDFNGGPPEDENEAIHRNDLRAAWDAAAAAKRERCEQVARKYESDSSVSADKARAMKNPPAEDCYTERAIAAHDIAERIRSDHP